MRKGDHIRHDGWNPILDEYIPSIDAKNEPKKTAYRMRTCKYCGKSKKLETGFYKRSGDHWYHKCKICVSADYRKKRDKK